MKKKMFLNHVELFTYYYLTQPALLANVLPGLAFSRTKW